MSQSEARKARRQLEAEASKAKFTPEGVVSSAMGPDGHVLITYERLLARIQQDFPLQFQIAYKSESTDIAEALVREKDNEIAALKARLAEYEPEAEEEVTPEVEEGPVAEEG